jgi:hypothetical protein
VAVFGRGKELDLIKKKIYINKYIFHIMILLIQDVCIYRHDIIKILLKVALNTIIHNLSFSNLTILPDNWNIAITTEQVTIIQLVTILLIYKVQKI